jgi:hypothetical protein
MNGKLKTQRHLKAATIVSPKQDYPFAKIEKKTLHKSQFTFEKHFVQSQENRKKIYLHFCEK